MFELKILLKRRVFPLIVRRDQAHRRFVAILGLPRHITNRLVDQNGDAQRLRSARLARQLHALVRQHALSEFGALAIDRDPAFFNVGVGFAARTQALIGEVFGNADTCGRGCFLRGVADGWLRLRSLWCHCWHRLRRCSFITQRFQLQIRIFGALSAIARATFGLNHTPIAKLTHAVAHFTVTQYGLWRFGQGLC